MDKNYIALCASVTTMTCTAIVVFGKLISKVIK